MLNPSRFEGRIRATGSVAVLGLAAVFAVLAYWQVFRTDLAEEEYNPRLLQTFSDPHRGRILDRNGEVLAESSADGTRHYHDASVAHVVGYLDPRYGSQGAELAFNGVLSGQQRKDDAWSAALDSEFKRQAGQGLDVRLTIDMRVQRAAAAALGTKKGAIVAIDPRNGEVLAMVSVPTYDPGALEEKGQELLIDPSSPLLNRATQGLYPPGSTFKTVTTISLLENQVVTPDQQVTCPGKVTIDGHDIDCSNVRQGVGTYPFRDAFAYSVNAIFARLGVDLGWDRLIATASKLGFGRSIDFALETAPTQVAPPAPQRSKALLADTAFGQGQLLATPLQMALVAAAVANEGMLPHPIIGLTAMKDGKPAGRLEASSSSRAFGVSVGRVMRELMLAVVEKGQAAGVDIPGVQVAGKTGTAETGHEGTSHAWFIAFAPADKPTIAVAVVVENGGRGGEVASPIAGQVLKAALAR